VQSSSSSRVKAEKGQGGVALVTDVFGRVARAAVGGVAAAGVALSVGTVAGPALADTYGLKLPLTDPNPTRCEDGVGGNTIGQSNGVALSLIDLRSCDYSGRKLAEVNLSGVILVEANFSGANLREAVMTKALAPGANFSGADLRGAVMDRVNFQEANFTGADMRASVISGVDFSKADLTDAKFEDAIIGVEDSKKMCQNPTLTGYSRFDVGCRN